MCLHRRISRGDFPIRRWIGSRKGGRGWEEISKTITPPAHLSHNGSGDSLMLYYLLMETTNPTQHCYHIPII